MSVLPIMMEEHVDDVAEHLRLCRWKIAHFNLIYGLFQLWKILVIFHCIVATQNKQNHS